MSFRSYIVDRAVIVPVVLVVLAGAYYLYHTAPEPAAAVPIVPATPVGFEWKYETATSTDGVPQTKVYVAVSYDNGSVKNNFVEQVPMSCNDLDMPEPDSVPHSKTMQCYAAGQGYRYKITKGEESYLIQSKAFEEALPDQVQPEHDYHVVSEIFF